MDFDWIWKAIIIVLAGTYLLRFAGRKSISQMTLAQTVIMIAIGSLLIQPVAGKSVWITIAVGGVLVVTLIVMEYAQIKFNWIEKLITGQAKVLINDGSIVEKNLKKLRLTVDQLEMKLRQQNVNKLTDVDWATLEPNGQIGFVLKQEAKPVTYKEFQQLKHDIQQLNLTLTSLLPEYETASKLIQELNQGQSYTPKKSSNHSESLFEEVVMKGHNDTPPKHLQ